jgi:hypothetical protein
LFLSSIVDFGLGELTGLLEEVSSDPEIENFERMKSGEGEHWNL